ncbi:site-specific DNA-methyltransferase (adenine-specific) [Halomicronema hongdechloris C2206]|uniref:Methyltransferase n=1 Tax=Halomicronema hongdechloris C2206 TaxID=1641165 RepID=A0A1Z3HQT7_9CYAN|nr:site-specific DNA-methyltransferase [Halomicronema hongdechloris]ASC72673.1 site-specific DNA-methyltransferase (adenine-specific) [Halomicronema hongdechloris C2206]
MGNPEINKERAPQNRTLTLRASEHDDLAKKVLTLHRPLAVDDLANKTICQDLLDALQYLPKGFVDLMILDPPYNLNKRFHSKSFKHMDDAAYADWLEGWISQLKGVLKEEASIYFCADWLTSAAAYPVLKKHFRVRNRITWEREKGRGAKRNWKNSCEDIWFCTVSDDYYFAVDAVKLKRRVIAPYRHKDGQPKDWEDHGPKKYRLTHPSNIWTDITVPFWSMPENTDHPTQKPEKLMAKLLLASSKPEDFVFDPFLGSGTTSVVSKKLGRRFLGIEVELDYCCLAEKRLALADREASIQGYSDGVFWERNSLAEQKRQTTPYPNDIQRHL